MDTFASFTGRELTDIELQEVRGGVALPLPIKLPKPHKFPHFGGPGFRRGGYDYGDDYGYDYGDDYGYDYGYDDDDE